MMKRGLGGVSMAIFFVLTWQGLGQRGGRYIHRLIAIHGPSDSLASSRLSVMIRVTHAFLTNKAATTNLTFTSGNPLSQWRAGSYDVTGSYAPCNALTPSSLLTGLATIINMFPPWSPAMLT